MNDLKLPWNRNRPFHPKAVDTASSETSDRLVVVANREPCEHVHDHAGRGPGRVVGLPESAASLLEEAIS